MSKETIEELVSKMKATDDKVDLFAYSLGLKDGAKWQQDNQFDIMQQYAAFCVKCDREKLPLLFAKEWFEQFKKK